MVVQLGRIAFLNKIYSPRGVNFCSPLSLKVVRGPPFCISFLGLTYIELQLYKLLPKSECRFYLGGMTLTDIKGKISVILLCLLVKDFEMTMIKW